MIKNFVEVGYQYRNYPDHWNKIIIGLEHALPAMREGTQHMVKTIRDNPGKYAPDRIQSFDLKFEELIDDIDLCPTCRYDIRFKDEFIGGTTPKFAEFKSYALSTWQNIVNKPKFLQQFERYLQDISEINELQYIFNRPKAGETQVKQAFKELFEAKRPEIFDVIWDSQNNLKIDLFGNRNRSAAESYFNQLINGAENNKLYSFIKSE
ncbi:MAG: hypothetical protein IPK25_08290 [Saprospiraceae bacterium]|nr:hypothetical protein [Saprospiraceae bacterium]